MVAPLFLFFAGTFGLFGNFLLNHYLFNLLDLHFGRPNLVHYNIDFNFLRLFFLDQLSRDVLDFWLRVGCVDFPSDVDLDVLLAFEDGLHDFDVVIAEDGDIVIVLIEEGDVEGGWVDVELPADEGDDVVEGEGTRVEFHLLVELEY
jgi:hypothetical protein